MLLPSPAPFPSPEPPAQPQEISLELGGSGCAGKVWLSYPELPLLFGFLRRVPSRCHLLHSSIEPSDDWSAGENTKAFALAMACLFASAAASMDSRFEITAAAIASRFAAAAAAASTGVSSPSPPPRAAAADGGTALP